MKICDTCGKESDDLQTLRESYRTKDVKEVCPDCEKIINDQLYKVRRLQSKMTFSLMQRFINIFRSKKRKNVSKPKSKRSIHVSGGPYYVNPDPYPTCPRPDPPKGQGGYIPEEEVPTLSDPPKGARVVTYREGKFEPEYHE